ncbi:UDP-glucose 4-epimerase GalE [Govanella unica]|uniref:UDP-glucose 4-epimerase n=1 Tax=Govanella unica TaxID=2975056 RepID=A0A9X3TZA8_9PROT|nr:UDP-glucose 4-epimerase GalE [Govania unica]MDA5194472.1 UDP-glucose 4-epimerase GalE [Govania unica]
MSVKVLVTGGAGYIGSHAAVELLAAGHEIVIIDSLVNAKAAALARIGEITQTKISFIEADIRDRSLVSDLFAAERFDAVMHFAGLKAVGESVAEPMRYYENNIGGSLALFEVMADHGVKTLVFSSSATVYGDPASVPIREDFPLSVTNPYGQTKLMIENMLRDLAAADPGWRIALLRYFNPVGAHASGMIGEDPNGIPNNLVPYITQVAIGKRPRLQVYGGDYPTADGTGVRDYIHVVDLVRGHLRALDYLAQTPGLVTANLGTGQGYSVLDMVRAFEAASGRPIPYDIVARRPGDVAQCYADPSFAAEHLNWRAEKTLADMCADSWRWQSMNPDGYPD